MKANPNRAQVPGAGYLTLMDPFNLHKALHDAEPGANELLRIPEWWVWRGAAEDIPISGLAAAWDSK